MTCPVGAEGSAVRDGRDEALEVPRCRTRGQSRCGWLRPRRSPCRWCQPQAFRDPDRASPSLPTPACSGVVLLRTMPNRLPFDIRRSADVPSTGGIATSDAQSPTSNPTGNKPMTHPILLFLTDDPDENKSWSRSVRELCDTTMLSTPSNGEQGGRLLILAAPQPCPDSRTGSPDRHTRARTRARFIHTGNPVSALRRAHCSRSSAPRRRLR
jgi:hypothetical protein